MSYVTQPPVCGFPTATGQCSAPPAYGLYTGMLHKLVARLCDEHIDEGERQLRAKHRDWMITAAHLSGAKSADGSSAPVVVKEYPDAAAYQRDAPVMAGFGYEVLTVSEAAQNAGVGRILTLGLFSLAVRPKSHYIVTYRLIMQPPTPTRP